jgi:hypothetical protein
MDNTATKVIVTPTPGSTSTQIHHRDFPEIRGEGVSVNEAADQLANSLTRALDTALTDWRREAINQAIADVNAFISSQES